MRAVAQFGHTLTVDQTQLCHGKALPKGAPTGPRCCSLTPAHRVQFKPSIPRYRARAESERSLMRRRAHERRKEIGRDVGDWSALGALNILERVRLQVLGQRPNA